jgi:hypothetical protein
MTCKYVTYDYLSLFKFKRVVKLLNQDYVDFDQDAKYFVIKSDTEFNYCKVFDTNRYNEDIKVNIPNVVVDESKVKPCSPVQLRNPKTKKCVSRTGRIGKKIIAENTKVKKYRILDIEFPITYNDCLLDNVATYYKKLFGRFILNSETKFKKSEWDDIKEVYTKKYTDTTCYTKIYPECMKLTKDQLYNISKNCINQDDEKVYIKPISSFNKKQLCKFIRTHPNIRTVTEKYEKQLKKYRELYKDKEIEEKFIKDILDCEYKYHISQISDEVFLFYFILKLVKDKGVIYIDLYKDVKKSKTMSEAKWDSYSEKFFFPKKFINFLKDGKSNIKILQMRIENKADAHSNLLIFNVEKKEFFRYDPSGTQHFANYDILKLEKHLEKLSKDLGYTYRYDFEFCPDVNIGDIAAYQEEVENIENEQGFCATYTTLLIELVIIEDSSDLYKTQKSFIDKIVKSKYSLRHFLRKYRSYIFGIVTDLIKNYGFEGDETETKKIVEFLEDNLTYIYDDLITE